VELTSANEYISTGTSLSTQRNINPRKVTCFSKVGTILGGIVLQYYFSKRYVEKKKWQKQNFLFSPVRFKQSK